MRIKEGNLQRRLDVEAFQLCLECSSLPDNKRDEVENELKAAKIRLQHQDDAVSCLL